MYHSWERQSKHENEWTRHEGERAELGETSVRELEGSKISGSEDMKEQKRKEVRMRELHANSRRKGFQAYFTSSNSAAAASPCWKIRVLANCLHRASNLCSFYNTESHSLITEQAKTSVHPSGLIGQHISVKRKIKHPVKDNWIHKANRKTQRIMLIFNCRIISCLRSDLSLLASHLAVELPSPVVLFCTSPIKNGLVVNFHQLPLWAVAEMSKHSTEYSRKCIQ